MAQLQPRFIAVLERTSQCLSKRDGILNASIHALAAGRAMNVRRIATEQDPAVAQAFCNPMQRVLACIDANGAGGCNARRPGHCSCSSCPSKPLPRVTRGPLHRTPCGGGSITAATSRSAQRPSASFPRRGARCPRRPPPPIRSARQAHTERRPRADGECARAPPALPPSR